MLLIASDGYILIVIPIEKSCVFINNKFFYTRYSKIKNAEHVTIIVSSYCHIKWQLFRCASNRIVFNYTG